MSTVDSLSAAGGARAPVDPTTHARQAQADQAIAEATTAKGQAQARVDQDRRNHSPSCVAIDQKGVDQAASQLASASSSLLSVDV